MKRTKNLTRSRRQILQGILATTALGLAKLGTGCTPNRSADSSQNKDQLIIGFIYVGSKDDFGYNQAQSEGAATIAQLPNVKIIEQASVPETKEAETAMREAIEIDGVTVLFPTSFGYFKPHVLKLAQEFPQVQFFHAGSLYRPGMPNNIGSYFGYIDEGVYLSGIAAGAMTKTKKLGFVAAKPIPLVLRNINSFTLGARSINPQVTTQVIFTGEWSQPLKEAEAVNSLADQGIDVISCHVDSPKVVIETTERRGLYACGYHANQSSLAPKGFLTGAEWNWRKIYTQYVQWLQEGKTLMNGGISHLVTGGVESDFWKLSPFGEVVTEEVKQKVETAKEKLRKGELVIYRGEIKDNTGKVVIAKGKEYLSKAIELDQIDWLVEGVLGKVS